MDLKVLKNIAYLGVTHSLNYILPLITLPYLVRILGVEKFGIVTFAHAVILVMLVIVDFGLNLVGAKEVAICRTNITAISVLMSNVLIIRLVLLLICFLILVAVVGSYLGIDELLLYVATYTYVIGFSLFPSWLFQGLGKVKLLAILTGMARIIYVALIFLMVDSASDYILVPLLNGFSYILVTITAYVVLVRFSDIKLIFPGIKNVWKFAISGLPVFGSNILTTTYTLFTTILLGLIAGPIQVGIYSSAEKIAKSIQNLMQPIFTVCFPESAKKLNENKREASDFLKKLYITVFGIGLLLSCLLFSNSEIIVAVFLGEQYAQSIEVLKWLALLPLVGGMNNVFGIQTLIAGGFKAAHIKIISFASVVFIPISLFLIHLYGALGAAKSLVFIELLLPSAFLVVILKKRIVW